MNENNWLEILSVGTNLSMVVVGIKLIRHISRIEYRVDTMWEVFMGRVKRHDDSQDEREEDKGRSHRLEEK